MEELIGWAVLFGKFWVIAQMLGYVFAVIITIIALIIIIKALCGRR